MPGNGAICSTRQKGILAELLAAHWLVNQGFWVFKPHGQQGPIDLIAISKHGKTYYFDVKAISRRVDGSHICRTLSSFQKKVGLMVLYVDLQTYEVSYTKPVEGSRKNRNSILQRKYVLEH